MTSDHERVQEALAARALHAVGDEGSLNLGSLNAHVRTCSTCRRAMEDFEVVAGDLALAAPVRRPPRPLRHSMRRSLREGAGAPGRARLLAVLAVAAVVALGAWNAHLLTRVGRAERLQANTSQLIAAVSHPSSRIVPLAAPDGSVGEGVAAAYVPGGGALFVFGSMPAPHAERVYQVWMRRQGVYERAGAFVPDREGFVLLRVAVDPSEYDAVLITEESGSGSEHPSAVQVAGSDL